MKYLMPSQEGKWNTAFRFGRGARDLHLLGHAFDQECALSTWCLLEDLALLSTVPLAHVAFGRNKQKRGCITSSVLLVWWCRPIGGNDSVLRQICDYKSSAYVPKWKFPVKCIISAMNIMLILPFKKVFKKWSKKDLFSDTAYFK